VKLVGCEFGLSTLESRNCSIVGATMCSLTNVGLYKIALSMTVESVETRGTNFLFQMLQ
jgi:hypothetical protein